MRQCIGCKKQKKADNCIECAVEAKRRLSDALNEIELIANGTTSMNAVISKVKEVRKESSEHLKAVSPADICKQLNCSGIDDKCPGNELCPAVKESRENPGDFRAAAAYLNREIVRELDTE